MSTEINVGYKLWESDLIPNFKFDCQEDADKFDKVLSEYIKDPVAKLEWDQAERQYASLYAVQYAINGFIFHFNLKGPKSEDLIEACENVIEIWESDNADSGDCYTPVMNYIFSKLHPGVQEKLINRL